MPYLSGNTNKKRMLNIGLSTSVNYHRTLLSSELELVSGETHFSRLFFFFGATYTVDIGL